jgi:hypothetical protein
MGTLILDNPLVAAVLKHEEVARDLARHLDYESNFRLTLSLLALRRAVGLPAVMVCAAPPTRRLGRYEDSIPAKDCTNADCYAAGTEESLEDWMQIPHDSEVKR